MVDATLASRAEAAGILPGYIGTDREYHEATEEQLRAVLDVLGDAPIAAATDDAPIRKCASYRQRIDRKRCTGLWANLYTVRSRRNWGIGDLTDLAALVRFAADSGAAFVGINPLHAQRNVWPDVSPYNGISRIYRNPIYLDLEAVPEFASSEEAAALVRSQRAELERLRASDRVDYDAVAALQWPVLEILAAACREGPRRDQLAVFRGRDRGLVVDFATHRVLAETHGPDWRWWPEELRDPRAEAVAAFREEHRDAVEVQVFAQFEMERQLAAVATTARDAGLQLGVYQDVALGSAISGFDAWAFPGLFADGASLGAPPDAYAEQGQDWGIPPLRPAALAADDYRYWRLVLRAAMEHSGMLRLDHAMGLTRCYWVPAGRPATEGCYVRYPLRELLAVLAEESRRHRCVVVAEDLGTVPPEFAGSLARAGILSSRVMMFERDDGGAFRPASAYSRRALVTANTHDHVTLAGYRAGRDLEIRRQLGLFAEEASFEAAQRDRARDLRSLAQRLRRARLLGSGEPSAAELCRAAYAFLARTPSPLLGVSLDDLAGELDPVNLPGVPQEVYPSWSRRMGTHLEDLLADSAVVTPVGTAGSALSWRFLRRSRRVPGNGGVVCPASNAFLPGAIMHRAVRHLLLLAAVAAGQHTLAAAQPPFPPVPVPAGNPITAAKANLGKVLYWDEQLSSTKTIACGTCHIPDRGGDDPRLGFFHPGPDGIFGNADDIQGSAGLPLSQADGSYLKATHFGLDVQVTGRTAPTVINSAFNPLQFWDGRSDGTFVDPLTSNVVIANGASLENQASKPPVGDAEMAHQGRDWNDVAARVAASEPLALATAIPAALATWIGNQSYADLFSLAFGSPDITPARILLAIATYERTLISNETPFDNQALTTRQLQGLQVFRGAARCDQCHVGPLFRNNDFANIGLRPPAEDPGRFAETGDPEDFGAFKTPGLRNVGLKSTFFHNGRFQSIAEVVDFYRRGGDFRGPAFNQDPRIRPFQITPQQRAALIDFLQNGLTDPRVAQGLPPFDRPTLNSETHRNPVHYGAGSAGTGGFTPRMIAVEPPMCGNPSFNLTLADGLGGANALLFFDVASGSGNPVAGVPLWLAPTQAAVGVALGPLRDAGAGGGLLVQHPSDPRPPDLLRRLSLPPGVRVRPRDPCRLGGDRGLVLHDVRRLLNPQAGCRRFDDDPRARSPGEGGRVFVAGSATARRLGAIPRGGLHVPRSRLRLVAPDEQRSRARTRPVGARLSRLPGHRRRSRVGAGVRCRGLGAAPGGVALDVRRPRRRGRGADHLLGRDAQRRAVRRPPSADAVAARHPGAPSAGRAPRRGPPARPPNEWGCPRVLTRCRRPRPASSAKQWRWRSRNCQNSTSPCFA